MPATITLAENSVDDASVNITATVANWDSNNYKLVDAKLLVNAGPKYGVVTIDIDEPLCITPETTQTIGSATTTMKNAKALVSSGNSQTPGDYEAQFTLKASNIRVNNALMNLKNGKAYNVMAELVYTDASSATPAALISANSNSLSFTPATDANAPAALSYQAISATSFGVIVPACAKDAEGITLDGGNQITKIVLAVSNQETGAIIRKEVTYPSNMYALVDAPTSVFVELNNSTDGIITDTLYIVTASYVNSKGFSPSSEPLECRPTNYMAPPSFVTSSMVQVDDNSCVKVNVTLGSDAAFSKQMPFLGLAVQQDDGVDNIIGGSLYYAPSADAVNATTPLLLSLVAQLPTEGFKVFANQPLYFVLPSILQSNTTYHFKATAVNTAGSDSSSTSAQFTVVPLAAPSGVTNLSVSRKVADASIDAAIVRLLAAESTGLNGLFGSLSIVPADPTTGELLTEASTEMAAAAAALTAYNAATIQLSAATVKSAIVTLGNTVKEAIGKIGDLRSAISTVGGSTQPSNVTVPLFAEMPTFAVTAPLSPFITAGSALGNLTSVMAATASASGASPAAAKTAYDNNIAAIQVLVSVVNTAITNYNTATATNPNAMMTRLNIITLAASANGGLVRNILNAVGSLVTPAEGALTTNASVLTKADVAQPTPTPDASITLYNTVLGYAKSIINFINSAALYEADQVASSNLSDFPTDVSTILAGIRSVGIDFNVVNANWNQPLNNWNSTGSSPGTYQITLSNFDDETVCQEYAVDYFLTQQAAGGSAATGADSLLTSAQILAKVQYVITNSAMTSKPTTAERVALWNAATAAQKNALTNSSATLKAAVSVYYLAKYINAIAQNAFKVLPEAAALVNNPNAEPSSTTYDLVLNGFPGNLSADPAGYFFAPAIVSGSKFDLKVVPSLLFTASQTKVFGPAATVSVQTNAASMAAPTITGVAGNLDIKISMEKLPWKYIAGVTGAIQINIVVTPPSGASTVKQLSLETNANGNVLAIKDKSLAEMGFPFMPSLAYSIYTSIASTHQDKLAPQVGGGFNSILKTASSSISKTPYAQPSPVPITSTTFVGGNAQIAVNLVPISDELLQGNAFTNVTYKVFRNATLAKSSWPTNPLALSAYYTTNVAAAVTTLTQSVPDGIKTAAVLNALGEEITPAVIFDTITGLTNGTVYYVVAVLNAAGQTSVPVLSDLISVHGAPAAPAAPLLDNKNGELTATLDLSATGPGQVDGMGGLYGQGLASYEWGIYSGAALVGSKTTTTNVLKVDQTSLPALQLGVAYTVKVKVTNALDDVSALGAASLAAVLAKPMTEVKASLGNKYTSGGDKYQDVIVEFVSNGAQPSAIALFGVDDKQVEVFQLYASNSLSNNVTGGAVNIADLPSFASPLTLSIKLSSTASQLIEGGSVIVVFDSEGSLAKDEL